MSNHPRNSIQVHCLVLLLVLVGSVACSANAAPLRKTPYLIFPGDPTTMQLLWQATATAPSTLEWGVDTGYGLGRIETREYGTDHQHTHTFVDLTPGELYFYRVVCDGAPSTGSFRAAPPADSPRVQFFVYGDTRSDPAAHDKVAGQILQAMDDDPERQTIVLSVGDLVSTGDSEQVMDGEFYSPDHANIRRLMAELPYQACKGNHEDHGRAFNKYFPYPYVDANYWSFDCGPAHILVVDQYESYAPGSEQYSWIKSDLQSTTKPWKFVLLHEPGWSAGGGHSNCKPVQMYLQPLFVEYGVSIVFGGHNHYYARAVVDGVQHLTIGGGGAPLYAPTTGAAHVLTAARSHHFGRIAIEGKRLTFTAVSGTTVLDTFSLGEE